MQCGGHGFFLWCEPVLGVLRSGSQGWRAQVVVCGPGGCVGGGVGCRFGGGCDAGGLRRYDGFGWFVGVEHRFGVLVIVVLVVAVG